LERALDADNPNEAEVESLLRDVATAQAASIRMRVFTELRIRRVLTTEQITVWRALRLEAARARRNEAPNPNSRRRIRSTPQTGFTPLFERRNQPPKSPRP
jgi:Spy/CpxP family protein refolding chaperone